MLFSEEQLQEQRSKGLVITDKENTGIIRPDKSVTYTITKEQFEHWLATLKWTEATKDVHREEFRGEISMGEFGIMY